MALTRINNQALTNVTSAGLPSGSVLQIVTVDDNTRRNFESRGQGTWYDDYTALNISITPKSNNSKLLFFVDIKYGTDGTSYSTFWQIREGTTIMSELNGGTSNSHPCFDQTRSEAYNDAIHYKLETASIIGGEVSNTATSQRSFNFRYKMQGGGTLAINKEGNVNSNQGNHSPTAQSRVMIMEIAG